MSDRRRPSLTDQQLAVEWAWRHVRDQGRRLKMRPSEIDEMERFLAAAIETLSNLQFQREVAR